MANGRQAVLSIHQKYRYHACKPHLIDSFFLINHVLLLHLTAKNAVIVAISLVGDIRGHHVGEVCAQEDSLRAVQILTSHLVTNKS